MPPPLAALPFLLHAVVETPAAFTFILAPSSQLSPLHPDAELLLQSFGGLLLATNLIALVFVRRPLDDDVRRVAVAFAFWHLWPCYRAVTRLRRGAGKRSGASKSKPHAGTDADTDTSTTLGGPAVHLVAHLGLFIMFLCTSLLGGHPRV